MKGPPAPGYSNELPALRPKRSGADPLIGILAKRSQSVKGFRFTHQKSLAGETFSSIVFLEIKITRSYLRRWKLKNCY